MQHGTRQAIHSLTPRVTQAQAVAALRGGLWRTLTGDPLRSVAEAYLPFRLYEVEVTNRGRRSTSIFGTDAVTGLLDLYVFEHAPTAAELVSLETSNSPLPQLAAAQSLALLEEKVRRAVFQAGFFRVRGLDVRARRLPADVHVPYWLGFFGSEGRARLRVMDAVRRQIEGAKARSLFEDWLVGRLGGAQPPLADGGGNAPRMSP